MIGSKASQQESGGHGRPAGESRWEAVYRETRRRILTLELPPGAPLSEVAVAREHGVSATPARDALGRLRQEGLVVVGPGRAYSVAGLSIVEVAQLTELRFVLETGIARFAMQRVTVEAISKLREVADRLGEAGLTPTELIRRNQDFHMAVAAMTGNDRLIEALGRVLDDSQRIFHLGITALPASEMAHNHATLIDAIERADLTAAIAVCAEEAFGTSERVVSRHVRGGLAESVS